MKTPRPVLVPARLGVPMPMISDMIMETFAGIQTLSFSVAPLCGELAQQKLVGIIRQAITIGPVIAEVETGFFLRLAERR